MGCGVGCGVPPLCPPCPIAVCVGEVGQNPTVCCGGNLGGAGGGEVGMDVNVWGGGGCPAGMAPVAP